MVASLIRYITIARATLDSCHQMRRECQDPTYVSPHWLYLKKTKFGNCTTLSGDAKPTIEWVQLVIARLLLAANGLRICSIHFNQLNLSRPAYLMPLKYPCLRQHYDHCESTLLAEASRFPGNRFHFPSLTSKLMKKSNIQKVDRSET